MYIFLLPVSLISFCYIVFAKPVKALIVYVMLVFTFSHIYTVPISSLDFTAARIAVFAMVINLFIHRGYLKHFRFNLLDGLMFVYFLARIVSLYHTVALPTLLEREGGRFIDIIIPYFFVRIFMVRIEDWIQLCKALTMLSVPLAALAIFQSFTGYNFLGPPNILTRHGMIRANLVFGDYISCGLFFVFTSILGISLYKYKIFRTWQYAVIWASQIIGVFATLSTAPLFALLITYGLVAFYSFRRYLSVLLYVILACFLFLEFYSNRHFYEIFVSFSFNPSTSYYRVGLVNEAMGGGMDGHWLYGYGYVGVGPGNDNSNFNWRYKDLVNLYIANLVRYGLLGLFPFFVINFLYYKYLNKALWVRDPRHHWFIWCLFAGLCGWNVSMMTVNAMGQIETLLYIMIACTNNLAHCIFPRPKRAPRRLPVKNLSAYRLAEG